MNINLQMRYENKEIKAQIRKVLQYYLMTQEILETNLDRQLQQYIVEFIEGQIQTHCSQQYENKLDRFPYNQFQEDEAADLEMFINDEYAKLQQRKRSLQSEAQIKLERSLRVKDIRNLNLTFKRLSQTLQIDNFQTPSLFILQKINEYEGDSNVINICISGFNSRNKCKVRKWQYLAAQENECFVLHWDAKDIKDFIQTPDHNTRQQALGTIQKLVFNATNRLIQTIKQISLHAKGANLFQQAFDEARNCGKLLAHLLVRKNIFGNKLINLHAFSLGTVVVQECVNELILLDEISNLNNVYLMAGVANSYHWTQDTLNQLYGNLHNFYCSTDYILSRLLPLVKINQNPCGMRRLPLNSLKIKNYDVTSEIKGHRQYQTNLEKIYSRIEGQNIIQN